MLDQFTDTYAHISDVSVVSGICDTIPINPITAIAELYNLDLQLTDFVDFAQFITVIRRYR